MKLTPPTYTIHQNKLKMIKDLNVSHEIINILEEIIGSTISDITNSNIFADVSPWAGEIKEKNKLMGL